MTIGQSITIARVKGKLTQTQLALKSGIAQSHLSMIEHDKILIVCIEEKRK